MRSGDPDNQKQQEQRRNYWDRMLGCPQSIADGRSNINGAKGLTDTIQANMETTPFDPAPKVTKLRAPSKPKVAANTRMIPTYLSVRW